MTPPRRRVLTGLAAASVVGLGGGLLAVDRAAPAVDSIGGPYARFLAQSDDLGPARSQPSGALRVITIVAVKNDLALVAAAGGPFRQFGPTFGPGPPSPANLQIAQDMGKYVNSFSWRGDPPR